MVGGYTIVNCDRPSKFFGSLHCLSVLVCYSIGKVKVHKVLYLARKSIQLSDSFPCKFCKILENFAKLVPQLCPFRNFFSQGSETFLSRCPLLRIIWIFVFPGRARVQTIIHRQLDKKTDITKIK